jgi:hypothetical protein
VQALSPQTHEMAHPISLVVLDTPSQDSISSYDDEDVFRSVSDISSASHVHLNYGAPGTPSRVVNITPAPMPGQRRILSSPPPSYSPFVNPPANPNDWVPEHRCHHYSGRPEHLVHFAVPDETCETLPTNPNGPGWRVQKWYGVI